MSVYKTETNRNRHFVIGFIDLNNIFVLCELHPKIIRLSHLVVDSDQQNLQTESYDDISANIVQHNKSSRCALHMKAILFLFFIILDPIITLGSIFICIEPCESPLSNIM
jgi:hypothetical protein